MPGSSMQRLWTTWDSIFHKLWHVRPIGTDGQYLFLVSTRRYYGYPFTVDGESVNRGDTVIELHMNNELLVDILREQKSAVGIAVKLLQEAKKSFPVLARRLASEEYEGIRVIYGVTFINRSVERFGFQTFPIRRKLLSGLTALYLKRVFVAVNPNARQLMQQHPETLVPRVVAISRAHFLADHLESAAETQSVADPISAPMPS